MTIISSSLFSITSQRKNSRSRNLSIRTFTTQTVLNKVRFFLITRLIIYKWLPIVIIVFLLTVIRIPVVFADEFWDAYAQAKWGTPNPTLEQLYPIKTGKALHDELAKYYADDLAKYRATLKSQAHNHITALFSSSTQRNHIGLPTLHTLSFIDTPHFVSTILHDYHKLLSNRFLNDRQMLTESLRFLKETLPQEIWATSPDQLRDANSPINYFQECLTQPNIIYSDSQKRAILYLRVSISIYNGFLLNNKDIVTDFDLAYKVFMLQLENQHKLTTR